MNHYKRKLVEADEINWEALNPDKVFGDVSNLKTFLDKVYHRHPIPELGNKKVEIKAILVYTENSSIIIEHQVRECKLIKSGVSLTFEHKKTDSTISLFWNKLVYDSWAEGDIGLSVEFVDTINKKLHYILRFQVV